MIGVDYASIDGNAPPDFAAAVVAGCRYVIVRGSYGTWHDPCVSRDAAAIRAAGLVFGAYLFPLMGKDHPPPETQVAAFSGGVTLKPGDMPPVIDVEFPGGIAKTGHTREELLDWIRHAVAALRKRYGIAPMIYTSARVWDGEDLDSLDADRLEPAPDLLECPLWLARYPYKTRSIAIGDSLEEAHRVAALPEPPVPAAWGKGNVWLQQYQGDAIWFPGFSATCDLNRFFNLGRGDAGARVLWAQRRLGMYEATPGVFDDAMADSVREFQRDRGLVADGVIGPRTFAHLAWCRAWPDEIDTSPGHG